MTTDPQTDTERRERYAKALAEITVGHRAFIKVDVQAEHERAEAVIAIADAEQAELRRERAVLPATRSELRDRIAAAVRTVPIKYGSDSIEPVSAEEAGTLADAVLAVLPAPADRAAVLAEAADAIEEAQHRRDDIVNDALGFLDNNTEQQHLAVHRAGRLLRRMADEEQQPETQAQPRPDFTSPIAGRIEVRDPCPWCGDRQLVPRSQMNEHVARLHPDVKTGPAAVAQPARTRLPSISTVTICASSKFYPAAKTLAEQLQRHGIRVHTPRFDHDEEQVAVSLDDKIRLTREFLNKIRGSDAVYVIDEDGYTGRSVCIEIGYAKALGRTVILAEPAVEGAVAALADAVIPVGDLPAAVVPGKEATQ